MHNQACTLVPCLHGAPRAWGLSLCLLAPRPRVRQQAQQPAEAAEAGRTHCAGPVVARR